MTITDGLVGIGKGLLSNPVATAVGGALAGGAVVGTAVAINRKRKKKSRKKSYKSRSTRRKSKRRTRRTPRTAGKGKDRSTKRIRHTKNGQPYVIMASGKARFISKRSARTSRRRKGGRY